MVRDATEQDVAAIQTIGLSTWPATYLPFTSPGFVLDGLATSWSETAVRRSITGSRTFVAETDGSVVGTATTGTLGGEQVLWKLYVLPEHHGRGAGRALLDAVLAAVGDRDLLVEVTVRNERALRFYRASAFRIEREEAGPHGTRTVWLRRPSGAPRS